MNIQIIYDSNHGHGKKVAESFNQKIYHVNDIFEIYEDFVVFICPTYGDEELPESMEKFMLNLKTKNKFYSICELGNYYGYDDFKFGSAKIIEHFLIKLDWKSFYKNFSMDSLPNLNWECFNEWKKGFYDDLQY